jgi:hypothetical protein
VNNPGYIYILSNPAMPGILKIGRSNRGGSVRAAECYTGATGVPSPFVLEFEISTKQPRHDESRVHSMLDAYRVNGKREFFAVDLGQAVKTVADVALRFNLSVRNSSETIEIECLKDVAASAGIDFSEIAGLITNLSADEWADLRKRSTSRYEEWLLELEDDGIDTSHYPRGGVA